MLNKEEKKKMFELAAKACGYEVSGEDLKAKEKQFDYGGDLTLMEVNQLNYYWYRYKEESDPVNLVQDLFRIMMMLSENWDEFGFDKLDGYPANMSFEELAHELNKFFTQEDNK